ncbi:disulfide oxidoreductase [Kurthia sibirica]|uniref:Disulfide bond formation protein B n=1 Tax=Kurthia sibirica TaxID=202750 RepID=A0A2U3AH54_9BACL|nr:disulfide oxidoreductase [Kurthia sibirica]PWI23892.1 disulfide bond formation protein B [Kurthia sibirica]GEK34923.1 putative disulfide formation protein C [Kurthia sibirica]
MTKKIEFSLLAMWVISLVAMMGSLFFSEVQKYEPCTFCWYQRILMYPLVLIIGVAYLQHNAKIAMTTLIFSIIGTCVALYHYGIQKIPYLHDNAAACGRVPCTGQYINWFGFVTIPFLSLLAFLLIMGLSIVILKASKEEEN